MKMSKILLVSAACAASCFSIACGGGSKSTTDQTTITTTGSNVLSIEVNTGPAASVGIAYANGAFASATVCVPGTSTCQTIGGLLVDTGSYGLRILSSALTTVSLPQQKNSSGDPVYECVQFVDSYTWGPVETADLQLSGETASSLPIQVLSDSAPTAPSSSACSPSSGLPSADTLQSLGANGILGVGLFPQDCGEFCATGGSATPPDAYYSCPSSGCTATFQSLTAQVQNPVTLFPKDNNGVIVELPAVSSVAETVNGSLVFGIGTETNNALGSATVYTADPNTGNFTTTFQSTTYSDEAFIDSGSNGYFFPDPANPSIPVCSATSGAGGFYCPPSTSNLSAAVKGITAGSGTVNFSVGNAETLFNDNPNDAAFADLGGTASGNFDWGLPFFYGRNVYTSIAGTTAPGGTTPYWAY
jgi:hypothetical protein